MIRDAVVLKVDRGIMISLHVSLTQVKRTGTIELYIKTEPGSQNLILLKSFVILKIWEDLKWVQLEGF